MTGKGILGQVGCRYGRVVAIMSLSVRGHGWKLLGLAARIIGACRMVFALALSGRRLALAGGVGILGTGSSLGRIGGGGRERFHRGVSLGNGRWFLVEVGSAAA